MYKIYFIHVVVLLGLVAAATAAPCIECKDCKTNNCLSNCQRSCGIDIEKCKKFGKDMGEQIGKDACATTQKYCGGGRSLGGGHGKKVSLEQCQNIAFGMCQSRAKETAIKGACMFAFNGFKECNKKQWADFFYPEVDELCARAAASIKP